MRKGVFSSLILFICLLLSACEDPQEIGSQVFAQDIGLVFTDTLTVDASTVLVDSIITSNTNNLLVGRYIDPVLGLVEASSFFQIVPADTLYSRVDTLGRKAVKWIRYPSKVDSIRFIMPYALYQGDTLQRQTFKITQLADNAVLDATKTYQNNSDAPSLKPTILGQLKDKRVTPIKNINILSGASRFDTLRVPITDPSFISFIVSQRDIKIKENALVGTGFRNTIKGLALTSESNNNAAIIGVLGGGAVGQSYMQIFYNYSYTYTILNKAGTADSTTIKVDTTKSNFLLVDQYTQTASGGRGASLNARFNRITTTRSGAFSKLIRPGDILTSAQTNNQLVLQSSTGLAMKVKFPTLLKLKERQDIAINKAELVLEPNITNYSLPTDLILIESTPSNRLLRNTSTGDGSLLFVSGEASTAAYVPKSNIYTFNVTSSLQNILSGRNKTNGWILSANTFATTTAGRGPISGKNIVSSEVDRAVFDSKKIKLRVYYTYVGK